MDDLRQLVLLQQMLLAVLVFSLQLVQQRRSLLNGHATSRQGGSKGSWRAVRGLSSAYSGTHRCGMGRVSVFCCPIAPAFNASVG